MTCFNCVIFFILVPVTVNMDVQMVRFRFKVQKQAGSKPPAPSPKHSSGPQDLIPSHQGESMPTCFDRVLVECHSSPNLFATTSMTYPNHHLSQHPLDLQSFTGLAELGLSHREIRFRFHEFGDTPGRRVKDWMHSEAHQLTRPLGPWYLFDPESGRSFRPQKRPVEAITVDSELREAIAWCLTASHADRRCFVSPRRARRNGVARVLSTVAGGFSPRNTVSSSSVFGTWMDMGISIMYTVYSNVVRREIHFSTWGSLCQWTMPRYWKQIDPIRQLDGFPRTASRHQREFNGPVQRRGTNTHKVKCLELESS